MYSIQMKELIRAAVLALVTVVTIPLTGFAQVDLTPERFSFAVDGPAVPGITSPAEFLGYEPGEQFSFHHDVVDYLTHLDSVSDRIQMHQYGTTYEGRPLYYLVVTSPANHARIEEIKANNLRLAEGDRLPTAEAADLIAANPAVVWLSYNVHGNEASSTEASMQVAYRLAVSDDPGVTSVLDESVVIIDPCINPDGRDRYVYWYRSMANNIVNKNAAELEHDEPWPGGRTNHYWFDLNRDWLWLVHPESRSRIAAYQEWLPQVHVDYHEQGYNSNYFTMPGTTPRNLEIPSAYDDWAKIFGDANAAAFDRHDINYATREAFDFYYPGYGSSYPTNMGAIGMLTEQGGHSRGGRAVKTNDEYVLTLAQRVFDHFTTSMATIETSVARRQALLSYFRDFFVNPDRDKTVFLFPDDEAGGNLYRMLKILHTHGVDIYRTTSTSVVTNTTDYWSNLPGRVNIPEGTFVVPVDQPRRVFVNTVLKRNLALEDSVTYDMTSWSMPLAYNIKAYHRSSSAGLSLEQVTELPEATSAVSKVGDPYAWVIDWSQQNAPMALAELWRKGYKVRAVRKTFSAGGKDYSRGTLVVLAGRNQKKSKSFVTDMQAVADYADVGVEALPSGQVEKGINLASSNSRPVPQPDVGLIVDSPISSYSAGQIWYMFDQDIKFGIDRIRKDDMGSIDLSEYEVIIVPGFNGSYKSLADTTMVESLKQWVSRGGVLIGLEQGADMLTSAQSKLTSIELRESLTSANDSTAGDGEDNYIRYEDREKQSGLKRIPGSAFRGTLDESNPLAFGMRTNVYSLKQRTAALEASDKYQIVGHYDKDPSRVLAAGYASEDEKKRLAGAVFAGVQPSGRGKYVLLVDNTQYRYFWIGPSRLLINAVMLLPGT
ncbi:MAG: hypothetical protein HKN43_17020 [Rhodothermales bacterium]|nr:hypothetical protein [Rhodothermales bacterium]